MKTFLDRGWYYFGLRVRAIEDVVSEVEVPSRWSGFLYSSGGFQPAAEPYDPVTGIRTRIPARVRRWVMVRDGFQCCHCGIELWEGGHIDHIWPLSQGGSNLAHNLQLLCPRCNLSKGWQVHPKDMGRIEQWSLKPRSA